VTVKGQGHDPNIFKAHYFENGLRQRFSFNRATSPSPTLHISCKKFTWRIYALPEHLLVGHGKGKVFSTISRNITLRNSMEVLQDSDATQQHVREAGVKLV